MDIIEVFNIVVGLIDYLTMAGTNVGRECEMNCLS